MRKIGCGALVLTALFASPAQSHPQDTEFNNSLLFTTPFIGLFDARMLMSLQQMFLYRGLMFDLPLVLLIPHLLQLSDQGPPSAAYASLGASPASEPQTGWGLGLGAATLYSEFDVDSPSIRQAGHSFAGAGGGEIFVSEAFTFGLLASYDTTTIDTRVNQGRVEASGFMISPFAVFRLGNGLAIDASAGWGAVDADTRRNDGFENVLGSTDGSRRFFSAGLSYSRSLENFGFSIRAGYHHQSLRFDPFTESNGQVVAGNRETLGIFSVGGNASYSLGSVTPFVGASWNVYDGQERIEVAPYQAAPGRDASDVEIRAGVNLAVADRLSAGVEVTHTLANSLSDQTSVLTRARLAF